MFQSAGPEKDKLKFVLREESIMQRIPMAKISNIRSPARLLVVDDDPMTADFLRAVGEREGYVIVSVTDGREAYRMLKSNADFVAAVFSMPMPNLNGVDLVRYMKTEKRLMRIPVVIVAGDHGSKLITDSFSAGALAFLPKPFTTDKLARTIRLAIGSQAVRKQVDEVRKLAA
jgi:two-component system aerobic respiration control sensor histidine kinase ArcB